mmetsp:Transcript_40089/g.85341  ORF Transcript_40089/g.85341 Transcript_40089/m.85341 type:complete len:220 (-) Transcript_40089:640-1299(-)
MQEGTVGVDGRTGRQHVHLMNCRSGIACLRHGASVGGGRGLVEGSHTGLVDVVLVDRKVLHCLGDAVQNMGLRIIRLGLATLVLDRDTALRTKLRDGRQTLRSLVNSMGSNLMHMMCLLTRKTTCSTLGLTDCLSLICKSIRPTTKLRHGRQGPLKPLLDLAMLPIADLLSGPPLGPRRGGRLRGARCAGVVILLPHAIRPVVAFLVHPAGIWGHGYLG